VGVEAATPLAAFQEINRRVRAENEARIRELVATSSAEKLWQGAFVQLPNSQVTSRFAEHRTYFLDGQPVSDAIHYGYDLATTARSPVVAANRGRVAFAGDLGIYGQTVILDHGTGIATLYGHLSQLEVADGESVEKGREIGRSGETGLAGGDHLHFAILVGGVYVDPLEWWDPKWVQEHVEAFLPAS
jgi:murein DD-endopeptidase MepM/ murein hydrolase activator NlpD